MHPSHCIQNTTHHCKNIENIFALHKYFVCVFVICVCSLLLLPSASCNSFIPISFQHFLSALYAFVRYSLLFFFICRLASPADLFISVRFPPNIYLCTFIAGEPSVQCTVKIASDKCIAWYFLLAQFDIHICFLLLLFFFVRARARERKRWGERARDICKRFNLLNAKNGLWLRWNEFCAHYNKSWDQLSSSNSNIQFYIMRYYALVNISPPFLYTLIQDGTHTHTPRHTKLDTRKCISYWWAHSLV